MPDRASQIHQYFFLPQPVINNCNLLYNLDVCDLAAVYYIISMSCFTVITFFHSCVCREIFTNVDISYASVVNFLMLQFFIQFITLFDSFYFLYVFQIK